MMVTIIALQSMEMFTDIRENFNFATTVTSHANYLKKISMVSSSETKSKYSHHHYCDSKVALLLSLCDTNNVIKKQRNNFEYHFAYTSNLMPPNTPPPIGLVFFK